MIGLLTVEFATTPVPPGEPAPGHEPPTARGRRRRRAWQRVGMVVVLAVAGTWLALPRFPTNTGKPMRPEVQPSPDPVPDPAAGDLTWWEVDRPAASRRPGKVGGYISQPVGQPKAVVIVLPGASTFEEDGTLGMARSFHRKFSTQLAAAGYAAWTLVVDETEPYGTADRADVRDALSYVHHHMIERFKTGKLAVVGYSRGGTLAWQAAQVSDFDLAIAIAGLTHPEMLREWRGAYSIAGWLHPDNTGVRQANATLAHDTTPDWNWHPAGPRPTRTELLFVHGEGDTIYSYSLFKLSMQPLATRAADEPITPRTQYHTISQAGHMHLYVNPAVIELVLRELDGITK